MTKKIHLDSEELIRLYTIDKISIKKLAIHYNVSGITISKNLKDLGIEVDPQPQKNKNVYNLDVSDVSKLIQEGKCVYEIAEIYQIDERQISKFLKNNNIEYNKNPVKKDIPTKQELFDLYWKDKKTFVEIGKIYNTSNVTAKKWFRLYDINTRSHSECIEVNTTKFNNDDTYYFVDLERIEDIEDEYLSIVKDYSKIIIYSDDLRERKVQINNYLNSKKDTNQKCNARDYETILIPSDVASYYIDNWHIQDIKKSKIIFACALKHKKTKNIEGIMSFGKHHRKNDKDTLILNRMCFDVDKTIRGGASKLLKCAIEHIKENYKEVKEIVSWSDSDISNGNVYDKMGFKLVEKLPYDYCYVNVSDRSYRFRESKQKYQKKYIDCKEGQTERERMKELGFIRLKCRGKHRWVLSLQ